MLVKLAKMYDQSHDKVLAKKVTRCIGIPHIIRAKSTAHVPSMYDVGPLSQGFLRMTCAAGTSGTWTSQSCGWFQ